MVKSPFFKDTAVSEEVSPCPFCFFATPMIFTSFMPPGRFCVYMEPRANLDRSSAPVPLTAASVSATRQYPTPKRRYTMKENKKVYIYSVKVKFQRKWQIFYASSVNDTTSLGVQDRYLHMRSRVTSVIF